MGMSVRWELAQYFERLWWKDYLSKKSPGEYLQWKTDYWQGLIDKLKATHPLLSFTLNTPNLKILDAGCGPAGTFLALEEHQVDAFDPLWSFYATQFSNLGYEQMQHVNFKECLLEDFSAEQQYNVVFCMNALNHVADIEKSIQNLTDALEPNGWLICTLDVHNSDFLKTSFKLIPGDILHPHQYNLVEYCELLQASGLRFIASINLKRERIFDHQMMVFRKV